MDDKIRRIYVPMTESGFYILYCLQTPQHGYGISQQVRKMTGGEVVISAGTMYGTLSKMEKDGLIHRKMYPEVPPKVEYTLTARGQSLVAVLDKLCDWGMENRP